MAGNSKTKRKSAGTKSKLKTKTPLTIRYIAEAERNMSLIPATALKKIAEETSVREDFISVLFRLLVGIELGKLFKEEEILLVIQNGIDSLNVLNTETNIRQVNGKTETWVIMFNYHVQVITTALEHVDALMKNTTRREQLEVHLLVEKNIGNLITENKLLPV